MSRTASGTVDWRGNPARWWARVTVRREDGTKARPWVDLERPDLKNTLEDKRTAKRLALKRARAASKGRFVGVEQASAPKTTLAGLETKWFTLIENDPDLKPGTVSRYKASWAMVIPKLGKRSVVDLTPPVLRAWVLDLRAAKSVSTVRNDVNALTRAFKDAIAQRWVSLTSNPMKDDYVRSAVPSMDSPEPDEIIQWTRAETEKLLDSPLSDLHFGMLLVSVTTGLRDGELHGLRFGDDGRDEKWPDVRRLHVLRQALRASEGRPVEIGSPKSKWGRRKVPLHASAATWLDWWKAEGWGAHVGRKPETDDYVFPNTDGKAWRPRAADLIRELLVAADMPEEFRLPDGETGDFTWHALRRTFASLLSDAGAPGEAIDYLLGQSPRTTRGRPYTAPPMNELARAVALLALALPERADVPSSTPSAPVESSPESSPQPQKMPVRKSTSEG